MQSDNYSVQTPRRFIKTKKLNVAKCLIEQIDTIYICLFLVYLKAVIGEFATYRR